MINLFDLLKLDKNLANSYFFDYKTKLIEGDYSPNSINIKLASVRSLVFYAFKLNYCTFTLDVAKLPSENYKDTSGTNTENIAKILAMPKIETVKGKRDYAILRLLWDCALRRSEISNLDIEDFNESELTLRIKGKGNFSKETIYLSSKTVEAIKQWLAVRNNPSLTKPLFISLDNCNNGHRLTGKSVYNIIKKYSLEVVEGKVLSPHQVRHSSITAVLNASNGNVRMAQKLSRHKNLDVLTKYDDNRVALQKEAVNLLADIA